MYKEKFLGKTSLNGRGRRRLLFLFVNVKKKIMKKVWWKGKKFVPLHPLKSVLRWL
jgi:hypothetical protein